MTKPNVSLKTMKAMKKYSILLSAAFAIFALASCQKEQDLANQEVVNNGPSSIPFELRANIPSIETKTTLNTSTWAVDWEDGDIIYAVTTDEEWGVAYDKDNPETESIAEFTYNENTGKFATNKEITSGEHTFNFIYSNGNQKTYHRGNSTTFSLAGTQTFDASAPTANLKTYDALAAQVTETTPTAFANVDMSHLFTLMKVTLNNKTGADVTISKFEVEIPGQHLSGIFTVNFSSTPTTTYKSGGGDKITVNVSNGTVANNGSLDVYFVMGPVFGYTGEVTFTVTDSASNTYTKTNTISAPGVSFAAGTYNTASYTLKTADPIECVTLDWNYAGGTSADLNAVPGVTTNGLGSDYAESHAPNRVKFDGTGDYIQVRTDVAISSVSVGFKKIGGAGNSTLTIKESENGSDWTDVQTLTLTGATNATGTVTTTNAFDASSRFIQIYFTKEANVGIGAISITKVNTDPVINVTSSNPMDVSNANDLYAIEYTITNPTGASISASANVAWIHDFDYSVDGEVAFEVDAQVTDAAARSGVITLSYTGANSVAVTVNQAAGPSSGAGSATTVFLEDFGSTSSNTAFASYSGFSATTSMFTTSGEVKSHYSGSGSVGKNNLAVTNLSNGYTGASGLSGCYHTGTANTEATIIQISNIDISGCTDLSLSFGALGGSSSHKVNVSYIIDGGAETSLISNGSITNSGWTLLSEDIPDTGSSLTLIFKHKPTKAWTIRMDDIKVVGTK